MQVKKPMRNDWGNVTQVRKGVWRLRFWAETDKGYRRCSETVRGTRRQAGDRLAELRVLHGHDAPCPTVGTCWRQWYLPDRTRMVEQGDLAPQSLVQYRSTWRCHVSMRWDSVPVDKIRTLEVQQWLFGLRRVAAQASLHLLRQLLDYPIRFGFIANNPFSIRYLLPSRSTIDKREDGVWSTNELGDVWHACHKTWFEPAVLLAGFGGCRVGEALGVRAGDVRLDCVCNVPIAFARIERQISAQAEEANRTKNRWSTRTTFLAGKPAIRLGMLAKKRDADEYLSHPDYRAYGTQRELRRAFAESLESHEVKVHLFKNLRKTWQTNMRWVLRLPPWVIEPMMGHVGQGVTGRYYDKPSEQVFCQMLAEAWAEHPFGDTYGWLDETGSWDNLGRAAAHVSH